MTLVVPHNSTTALCIRSLWITGTSGYTNPQNPSPPRILLHIAKAPLLSAQCRQLYLVGSFTVVGVLLTVFCWSRTPAYIHWLLLTINKSCNWATLSQFTLHFWNSEYDLVTSEFQKKNNRFTGRWQELDMSYSWHQIDKVHIKLTFPCIDTLQVATMHDFERSCSISILKKTTESSLLDRECYWVTQLHTA